MSGRQDEFVQSEPAQDENVPLSRVIASKRQGERLREMGDGTEMSLQERLEYAVSLIPRDRLEAAAGRSYKQMKRYLDGADVPFSVLTMISVASGVPVDWLAAGRPTRGLSSFDKWRIGLSEDKAVPSSASGSIAQLDAQPIDMSSGTETLKLQDRAAEDFQVLDDDKTVADRAQRLREAVRAAGGNRAVAAKAGILVGRLNDHLAGRDMKAATLVALADACEVSLEWLARGTGPMKPGQPEAGRAAESRPPTLFGTVDMDRLANAVQLAQMSYAQAGRPIEPRNFAQMFCMIYDMLGKKTDSPAALFSEILAAINVRIDGIR